MVAAIVGSALAFLLLACASAEARTSAPLAFATTPPSAPVAGIGSYQASATSVPGLSVDLIASGACAFSPRRAGLTTPLQGSGDPLADAASGKRSSPQTVYFIAAGVCRVTAITGRVALVEGENAEQYVETSAEQTVLVAKDPRDQISFTTPAPKRATVEGTYEPAVRSSAGVLPWISVATPSVCQILGETSKKVTVIAPGTCTIDANQAADVDEEPKGPEESEAHQSFTVRARSKTAHGCGISAPARAELLKYALNAARASGDPHPSDIEAVRTTRGQALSLGNTTEPGANPDTPVYLLAMRGEFEYNGPRPPPAPAETLRQEAPASVITLEVLASSPLARGGLEGWGHSYPDLAELGTPIDLEASGETQCSARKRRG